MRFAESRYYHHGRWGLALVFALVFLGLVGHVLSKTAPSEEAASLPVQVLGELEQANTARAGLSKAQSQWQEEKQKIDLLLSTVRRQRDHYQARADRDNKLRREREKQLAAFETNRKRLADIEVMLDTLCERLEISLEKLRARNFPGLVPPDKAQRITDPGGRLVSAVRRIEETRLRAKNSAVELVVGSLEGEELTVKLLRAGAAAAWWISLDGLQAGTAKMNRDKLVLTSATGPGDVQNIQAAFNVVEGRLAPLWLLVPAGKLQVTPVKEAGK